jgi:outer membrane protein OmpA-like peptidoglycan-associated protein
MKRTAMVAVLGLLSWSAQAAHDVPGWRVGAAASFSDFDWTDGDTDLIKDSTVGVKLYTQYQFNDWFGIEGAYHNTGDFEELSTDQNNPGELELSFDGFSAALIGYVPVPSEEIKLYGKVGLYDFDDELSLNGTVTSNSSEDGLMAGAGAMIEIADNFGIRADFDWFDAEVGDIWSVNLGLEYFFGGKKAVAAAAAPVAAAAVSEEPPPPPPPADADGDGVGDTSDQCPDTPAGDRVGPRGCSCDVTRQVEFEFDSATLTDAGKATLDEVAETLARLKFVEGTVTGHTDSEGEEGYNQQLSEKRAQAVAEYLEAKGIAAGRLTASGKGESEPVADNDTEEGRAKNRRVVLRRTDCDAGS